METVQVQNKFKLLFEKVCEPGYVMNNYYADGLINKLTHDSDPEITNMKLLAMISENVTEAWNHINNCHFTVQVFLTRLLGVTSHQELLCTKMFCKQGPQIVQGFKEISSPDMKPSLRVAYMEVALAIVSHDTGVSWLLESGVWKEILTLCNEKQTVFVVRQTYKFASHFIWKLNDMNDENNLRIIFNHMFKSSSDMDFMSMQTINEDMYTKTLEPMLQIIHSIVSETERVRRPNCAINMMLKEYGVLSLCYIVSDRIRDIAPLAVNVAFKLVMAKMFSIKPFTPDTVYCNEDFIELTAMYFNAIIRFVQRRWVNQLLDFCVFCNLTWAVIGKDLKYDAECGKVPNQLLFLCLVPPLVYIKEIRKEPCELLNDRIGEYIEKFSCEHTTRAAYAVRDLTTTMDALTVTIASVKRLACLKTHLNNEQANLVFQALFHMLIKFDPTVGDNGLESTTNNDYEDNQDLIQMMTYVLDTVHYLVKHHDINWHESLEVICLYNIVFNILKRTNLTCKFIVTALNVIAQTVKKFLPPNLSLLMESKPGSAMHELGQLIYMKMHDRNWEIRDSALELLLVCTEICYVKFPPFQKQILENNLLNVAATLALNENESYVQASALKCIAAATKVTSLWDQLLTEHADILEKLISIFRNNQEGIVRKEACWALHEVYQNLKLSPTFKHLLYDHMVSSALTDFHWEVQLKALKFWNAVIQSTLNDQGMLDGNFPPVTFSRESRKIVTLNEAEIQKRLLRTLDELAQIGCLTVLVKLLSEDTEVEILDVAWTISVELLEVLNRYKVPDVIKLNPGDVATVDELLCNIKEVEEHADHEMTDPEAKSKAEKVIEGIINADDINLLANIYERHMNIEANKTEVCTPKIKLFKFASPYLFVNHLKKDFKSVIEQKKKWKKGIRSLSSLLDDVLGIYEINDEINTLDCY